MSMNAVQAAGAAIRPVLIVSLTRQRHFVTGRGLVTGASPGDGIV